MRTALLFMVLAVLNLEASDPCFRILYEESFFARTPSERMLTGEVREKYLRLLDATPSPGVTVVTDSSTHYRLVPPDLLERDQIFGMILPKLFETFPDARQIEGFSPKEFSSNYKDLVLEAWRRGVLFLGMFQPWQGKKLNLQFAPLPPNDAALKFQDWAGSIGLDLQEGIVTPGTVITPGEFGHPESRIYQSLESANVYGAIYEGDQAFGVDVVNRLFAASPYLKRVDGMTRDLFDGLAADGFLHLDSFPRSLWHGSMPTAPGEAAAGLANYGYQSGMDLFRQVALSEPGQNTLVSSLGSESVLTALQLGARDRTGQQIASTFHLLGEDANSVYGAWNARNHYWQQANGRLDAEQFSFIPGIFVNKKGSDQVMLRPEYVQAVKTNLGGDVAYFEFADSSQVSEKAVIKGPFGQILTSVPVKAEEEMVLYSYVRATGTFKEPFKPRGAMRFIIERPGHLTQNIVHAALALEHPIPLLEDREYTAVSLDTYSPKLKVDIIVPRTGVSIERVIELLSGSNYQALTQRLDGYKYPKMMRLIVPEVKPMTGHTDLRAAYRAMGLDLPFGGEGDLSGISPVRLRASRFEQDLLYSFSPNAISFTALTTMGMMSLSAGSYEEEKPLPEFWVDRNHLVLVRDPATETLMCTLKIVDPRRK